MKTVAIVGRPNVGKSALFNKLTGIRAAIVEDVPGVTRDRLYGKVEWCGHSFNLIDTGGIEPLSKEIIPVHIREQARIAIDTADVIIFVTDIRAGLTTEDEDVANILRRSGKPVVLCVNKIDSPGEPPPELYTFYNLGLDEPYPVSSVHGSGTGDLLDKVVSLFSDEETEVLYGGDTLKVAVIGRPNAGKSSLVNHVLGEKRLIVSDIAGTTRDAIDTAVKVNGQDYVLIDTAGIRRKSRVDDLVEKYSVLRAYTAVERADVCVIMLDAEQGFTEQDSKIAGFAHEKGKASVIAVNKWDLIAKNDKTMREFQQKLESDFSFMSYVPFVFISATTGQRIDKLFELINHAAEQNARRITTGQLNDLLAFATARVQPPTDKGRRLKIYYMTQVASKPPAFVAFCNRADLFHFSYRRYIENQIREAFSLDSTPITLTVRERDRNDV
ncbi:MAG: ribosome biogenesis GTPase Der [Oscillospiraceae bacterium]|jgi:GTP-binding protein|nr:ribosome biogenesis GTPase Der [Oscillospiraceae bacterium]